MKVFSRDLFSFHNISDVLMSKTKFDWPDWTQSGLWIGYGFCKIPCTSVSGCDRVTIEPHALIEQFSEVLFCFFTASVCSEHQTILHHLSVKQNLTPLWPPFWCFTSCNNLLGGPVLFLVLRSRFGTLLACVTTTDSADSLWNETKVKKDCNYCWNMNMYKTLLKTLFVLFSIAERRPLFGPKEQYISGVCNYLLLTTCQVCHCKIRLSSQGQTLWATGNLENLLHG